MAFLSGFSKRKAIKYGTVLPGENLTDFPFLIRTFSDADIAAELTSGGGIAITRADETTLVPFGVYPSSDPASGDFILRAKFPTLLTAASTGDTIGYIYYDSGQSTTEDKAGVMDGNYVLFMPLEEDPSGSAPQMFDWVSESNIGTSNGSMTSGDLVTGVVDNGIDFDGSDDLIALDSSVLAAIQALTTITLQVNAQFTNTSTTRTFFSTLGGGTNGWYFAIEASENLLVRSGNANVTSFSLDFTATVGQFHQVGFTSDGSRNIIFYGDGVAESISAANAPGTSSLVARLGAGNLTNYFLGQLDEFSISSVVRSASWIAYSYENDNTPDTLSFGAEEEDGAPPTGGNRRRRMLICGAA